MLTLFFSTMFIFYASAQSNTDQAIFDQANQLRANGEFEKAYSLYEQLPSQQPSVLYQKGRCLYGQKQYGAALASWRKAERFWTIQGRLELARHIIRAKSKGAFDNNNKPIPSLLLMQTLGYSFMVSVPSIFIQLLVILLWILLFIFIKKLYRSGHKIIIFFAFVLLCACAFLLAFKFGISQKTHVVTIKKSSDIFSGPGRNFALIGQIPEALEPTVLRASGNFYKIKTPSLIGWIEKNDIEEIS